MKSNNNYYYTDYNQSFHRWHLGLWLSEVGFEPDFGLWALWAKTRYSFSFLSHSNSHSNSHYNLILSIISVLMSVIILRDLGHTMITFHKSIEIHLEEDGFEKKIRKEWEKEWERNEKVHRFRSQYHRTHTKIEEILLPTTAFGELTI